MYDSLPASLKRRAMELIRATKPSPLLASLFLFVITSVVSMLTMYLTGYYDVITSVTTSIFSGYEISTEQILALSEQYTSLGGTMLSVALSLCITVITTGFSWYCYRVARGETPEIKSIFDGFGSFFKIIRLSIAIGFLVIIQTLLLVVPGIIAAMRYSQAVYIMYEHPEYGVLDCISESKRMMTGHKGEYFILQLSFIGWVLVGAFVSMYIPFPVLDIWINIYLGLATALYHVRLIRAELAGKDHIDADM